MDVPEAETLLKMIATARLASDIEALIGQFAADASFQVVGLGEPSAGTAAIRAALEHLLSEFEFIEWVPKQIFVNGDAIASRHHLKVRHRPSGRTAETETAEFLSMRDGKCRAFVQFADTALIAAMTKADE